MRRTRSPATALKRLCQALGWTHRVEGRTHVVDRPVGERWGVTLQIRKPATRALALSADMARAKVREGRDDPRPAVRYRPRSTPQRGLAAWEVDALRWLTTPPTDGGTP